VNMNPLALMDSGRAGRERPRITKLILCEVDAMTQQYQRGYAVNSTGETARQIQDRVDQVGFSPQAINHGLFSGMVSNYIAPSVESKPVNIPGGWSTGRFFFLLEVEIQSELNVRTEMIQGYTDRSDVSVGGLLDPRMVFHINSVVTLRNVPTTTPTGHRYMAQQIQDASHVLVNHDAANLTTAFGPNVPHLGRPMDVFSNIIKQETGYGNGVFDGRTVMMGKPKMSRRSNGLQSEFMAQVVGGCMLANTEHINHDDMNIYSQALGKVQEQELSSTSFITWLQMVNHGNTASFEYNTLLTADPLLDNTADHRVQIVMKNRGLTRVVENPFGGNWGNHSNESNSFADRGLTSVAATMICNSLPSLMIRHGIGDVAFRATNANPMNPMMPTTFAYERAPVDITSVPIPNGLASLQDKIINDLLAAISYNNSMSYEVRVMCQVFGRIEIEIQIETERARYVSAAFADGLMAPVWAGSADNLNDIGTSFKYLLNDVLHVTSGTNFADEYAAANGTSFEHHI
jgi:hypothetical protein